MEHVTMIKRAIKTILPKPVLNAAIDWRGQAQLSAIPRHAFRPGNLKSAEALGINELLQSASFTDDWSTDHKAIAEAIGDENMMGGVNPGDRRAIYALVHALKPARVLEVGTHIAASSLYIAAALKRAGGALTTVDIIDVNAAGAPWTEAGYKVPPKDYAAKLGLKIRFVQSPAVAFMKETKERFDFIFLDGDHAPVSVYHEVAAALNILNPGGVILLHDYYPGAKPLWADGNIISGPFRALDRVAKEHSGIAVHPLGDLPWPTKQGSRKTSLAMVLGKP